MSWRHRIATLLLLVLAGVPIGGTLCTMACSAASPQAAHHGSGQTCEDSARPSPDPQVNDVSQHPCSTHDPTMQWLATAAAARADLAVKAAHSVPAATHRELVIPIGWESAFNCPAPPGTAPPTTTPRVLRV